MFHDEHIGLENPYKTSEVMYPNAIYPCSFSRRTSYTRVHSKDSWIRNGYIVFNVLGLFYWSYSIWFLYLWQTKNMKRKEYKTEDKKI